MGGLVGHDDGVSSVCFDSKEQYVLSGSYDNTAILWDFRKLKKVNRIFIDFLVLRAY